MPFGMAMQMDLLVTALATPAKAAPYLTGLNHAGLVRSLYQHSFTLVELGGDLDVVRFFPQQASRSGCGGRNSVYPGGRCLAILNKSSVMREGLYNRSGRF